MMARHARVTLTRYSHHGEDILYRSAGGSEVTVRAVVERRDVEPIDGVMPAIARLACTVFIARDATVGVLAIAPGDVVTLAMRLGDEPVDARVTRIVSQDEGGFLVEVAA
jgi:hypothetical protein